MICVCGGFVCWFLCLCWWVGVLCYGVWLSGVLLCVLCEDCSLLIICCMALVMMLGVL